MHLIPETIQYAYREDDVAAAVAVGDDDEYDVVAAVAFDHLIVLCCVDDFATMEFSYPVECEFVMEILVAKFYLKFIKIKIIFDKLNKKKISFSNEIPPIVGFGFACNEYFGFRFLV